MRPRALFAALAAASSMVGCQLLIGWEQAELICPPGDPTCAPCVTPADCGPAPPCHPWQCVGGLCLTGFAGEGATCPGGYCTVSPDSLCVECLDDSHCPTGSYCGNNNCGRCDDGIGNGDELDVDCGGHCPGCLGDFCSSDGACLSGHCADGVCCDSPCKTLCWSCDPTGICNLVPKYGEDYAPQCLGKTLCNGGGNCLLRDGENCVDGSDCVSFKCENNLCVP
jgi:hypothetical protein